MPVSFLVSHILNTVMAETDELQANLPSDDGIGSADGNPRAPAEPWSGDRTPDGSRGAAQRQSHRLSKKLVKQRSWSTESSRDEAWEKQRDQFLRRESHCKQAKCVGRSVSDFCSGGKGVKARPRARSLTDEDLDELRGCIELGFGFSSAEENHELCNTLPALDLYYAINRQYIDCKLKASPVSTPDSSSSCGSPMSPLCETWKISSPGDNPQHVKTRLRCRLGCLRAGQQVGGPPKGGARLLLACWASRGELGRLGGAQKQGNKPSSSNKMPKNEISTHQQSAPRRMNLHYQPPTR